MGFEEYSHAVEFWEGNSNKTFWASVSDTNCITAEGGALVCDHKHANKQEALRCFRERKMSEVGNV